MEIGPVDYMIVAFPGNKFTGRDRACTGRARRVGHDPDHRPRLRRQGRRRRRRRVRAERAPPRRPARPRAPASRSSGLFNEDDLVDAGEALEPNSSAALLVWENVWATRARRGDPRRRAASSSTLGRIPHDAVVAARECALRDRYRTHERGGLSMMRRRGPGWCASPRPRRWSRGRREPSAPPAAEVRRPGRSAQEQYAAAAAAPLPSRRRRPSSRPTWPSSSSSRS